MISVIVPVYNVERYLRRCVESIEKQTYEDIEIILIDDGSTDNSGKICDELKLEDSRIKVLHISNGGAARARNYGLNEACGDYISFIDSDDWIMPTFLEALIRVCENNNADIAKCEVIDVKSEKDEVVTPERINVKVYEPVEILNNIYMNRKLFNVAIMNKLYKKSIFEGLRFKEGIINEDEEILCRIILNSKRIAITNEVLYCYFLSQNSVTRSKFRPKNMDIIKCFDARISQLKNEKYHVALMQTYADYQKTLGILCFNVYTSNWNEKEKYLKQIKEKIHEVNKANKQNKYFSMSEKIKFSMRIHFPKIMQIFSEWKNRKKASLIGIITLNDNNNYGNRLQNYALLKQLKKLRIDATNIVNIMDSRKSVYRNILSKLKNNIKNITNKDRIERKNNFANFQKACIQNVFVYSSKNIKKKIYKYRFFLLGSDQVWNPDYMDSFYMNFALFAPNEKVIAYAASFGINNIPEEKKQFYIDGLSNVSKISVREDRGAGIVKELIGREAQVVLDPTLLLDREDWKKIMKEPKFVPKKKYILTYFLGNISDERKKKFEELANKNNFEIVNLGKMEYPQYYIAGPSEFLWYFNNAEIVFTDSFHACVFSIIFDKTFYSMNREDKSVSMNSRIETLLSKFKLNNRKFYDWENVSLQHDYSHVQEILEKEKKASLDFLEEALKIKE